MSHMALNSAWDSDLILSNHRILGISSKSKPDIKFGIQKIGTHPCYQELITSSATNR